MTAAVNLPTLRLIRVRVGNIKLGELNISGIKEVSSLL
jgi:23S rRNA pseudouridine2457 synthase